MYVFLRMVLVAFLIGFGKAHVRLMIMAILGLVGLWMIHTLAQDYQKISQTWNAGSTIKKLFSKRDVNNCSVSEHVKKNLEINWQHILWKDPIGCGRSFLCQIAADNENKISTEEKAILSLARFALQNGTDLASDVYKNAINYGEQVLNPQLCHSIYPTCPYNKTTMLKLLQMLSRIRATIYN